MSRLFFPDKAIGLILTTFCSITVAASTTDELSKFTLEDLGNIEVTSLSKSAEPLRQAASSIFVISRDDILRVGARTIPEMLRLAPNLQVAQTGSGSYVISARGFTGNPQAQSFSNKLLVLIDGRSVYSPLFSGVYWDMHDVVPEDIDRIEVISGPGATLWGANAVNGVINIITRNAHETAHGIVNADAGNLHRAATLRYGDENDHAAYRAYVKGSQFEPSRLADRTSAGDDWSRSQSGFRVDSTIDVDRFTLQGDIYRAVEQQESPGDLLAEGGNALVRWQRQLLGRGVLQLQSFYDQVQRYNTGDDSGFVQKTYDIELQHNLSALGPNAIIWGIGYRAVHYDITPSASLNFDPSERTLDLANLFIEDTLTIAQDWKFVAGLKFEKATDADFAVMPSARLAWNATPTSTLWLSASKAVRSSTPFDRDVVEFQGATIALTGDKNFDNETVQAYQLGLRAQPTQALSLSVTLFKQYYNDLRTIERDPTTSIFIWGNRMQGHTYGAEVWGAYQILPTWRLSAGWNGLHKNLRFEEGSTELTGLAQAGNDSSNQGMLRSSLDLTSAVTFDTTLRGVRELPDPHVPGYVELDARLGWILNPRFSLAVVGNNLLNEQHQEFTEPSTFVRREFFLQASWKFK